MVQVVLVAVLVDSCQCSLTITTAAAAVARIALAHTLSTASVHLTLTPAAAAGAHAVNSGRQQLSVLLLVQCLAAATASVLHFCQIIQCSLCCQVLNCVISGTSLCSVSSSVLDNASLINSLYCSIYTNRTQCVEHERVHKVTNLQSAYTNSTGQFNND
jgi:hypothetical protein